jgi:alanine-synthesizing transaminase
VRFSSRIDVSQPNPIAACEAEAKARGVDLDKLNDSNPTAHGLAPQLLPQVYRAQPRGQMEARRRLARAIGCPDPERLYLLSSTSQAYAWLMMLLCDPGEAVLAPKPGYPLIESIARLCGVKTVEYQLQFDGSWYMDIAALRTILERDGQAGRHIRALIVINPNNPTGQYVKPSEREHLIELCREFGIALIADEVFFDYALEPFEGNRRFAGERRVLTFALDGFSKRLAAPHAKVGWIEVSGPDDDVREAMRRLDVIADDFLPMSELIAERMDDMIAELDSQHDRVQERISRNLESLHRLLDADDLGVVSVLRAEGGWNVLLRFPSFIDENELVTTMIRDNATSGQPGYFFDMEANGYLAISLLPVPDLFDAHVRLVLSAVRHCVEEI